MAYKMGDVALGALALVLVAVLLPAERTHAARAATKAPSHAVRSLFGAPSSIVPSPFPTYYPTPTPKSKCRGGYSCGTLAGIIVGCVVSGLCIMIIGCRQGPCRLGRRQAAARQHNAATTARTTRRTTGTCSLSLALSALPVVPAVLQRTHMSFCVCRNRDAAANAQCASNVCAGNARLFEYCTACGGPQDGHGGGGGGGTLCPIRTPCPLSTVCAADGDGGCDGDGTVCPIGTGCAADGHTHRQRGWRRRRRRSRRRRCCVGARAARRPAPGRRSLRRAVRGGEAARPGQGGVVCEPDLSRSGYPTSTSLVYTH